VIAAAGKKEAEIIGSRLLAIPASKLIGNVCFLER
jgi:hypothetical protein